MYEQIQLTAWKCRCEKCGHEWTTRGANLSTHCPNRSCTNPTKWDVAGLSRPYTENTETKASSEWIDIGEKWNEITGEMVAMERHYKTNDVRAKR